MIIVLVGRKTGQSDSSHKDIRKLLIEFAELIYDRGHEPMFDEETAVNFLVGTPFLFNHADTLQIGSFGDIAQAAEVCIVLGGDGTMLNAAKQIHSPDRSIPLLGINLGNVGFITDVAADVRKDVIIEMLENHEYISEKRTMLTLNHAGVWLTALNDVVISRSTGKIIEFKVRIDGQPAYTARGDGLIISTPTGSTAYALSGGGPIVHPTARVIEIIPIMAQSLSTRPLIINDTSIVGIELVSGDAEIFLDGQLLREMKPKERFETARSNRFVEFIHPNLPDLNHTYSYYDTLAEKLNWHFLPGTRRT